MSSTAAPARRNPFRKPVDDGPRASFRELLPYLTEHRLVLGIVVVLGLIGAALSLAQPLLVSQVIRTNEQQVWFVSEHLVDEPLVGNGKR